MLIEKIFEWSKTGFQNFMSKFENRDFSIIKHIVFILGLIIYIIARINHVAAPIFESSTLPGVDDSYNHVVTGIQTETCFLQDCVAMEDLREQLLISTSDEYVAQKRDRQYTRLFIYYHPLYSFLYAGIHSIGFTPEIAFNILTVFGVILVNLAIIYFLYTVWGPGPTGITLGILANASRMGGNGYTASNIATGIAILSWAMIIKNPKRKAITIPLLILAMCAMHNIGQIYSVVTLALFLLLSTWPLKKRTWIVLGISITIILTFFFILPLIHRPELARWDATWFYTGDWNPEKMFQETITFALNSLRYFGSTKLGFISAALLILFGVFKNAKTKNQVFALGGLLGGLFIMSVFYIVPWFPAIVTGRVWTPLRIFLLGAIGYALWVWAKILMEYLFDSIRQKTKITDKTNPIISFIFKDIVILTFIVFIFIHQTIVYNESLNGRQVQKGKERQIYLNYWLDQEQPDLLQAEIEEGDFVLYMDELPMYYFFSHGTLQNHSVYYPAVYDSPEQKKWIDENENIGYLVTINPVNRFVNKNTRLGTSAVPNFINGKEIIIESDSQFNLSEVELLLKNLGNSHEKITIAYSEDGVHETEYKVIVPSGTSDWLAINSQEDVWVNQVKITVKKEQLNLILEGLHTEGNQALNWPWDQGITLKLLELKNLDENPVIIPFESDMLDEGLKLELQVIADNGVSVLAEVKH